MIVGSKSKNKIVNDAQERARESLKKSFEKHGFTLTPDGQLIMGETMQCSNCGKHCSKDEFEVCYGCKKKFTEKFIEEPEIVEKLKDYIIGNVIANKLSDD